MEDEIKAMAKESYKENVGRPKSTQKSAAINHTETRKEIAKLAGV